MKIAYILFNGITLLDFIGFYECLKYVKSKGFMDNLSWDLCATEKTIQDDYGLEIVIDKIMPDLSDYNIVMVPGGYGTRKLQYDKAFIKWLKTAKNAKYILSVCTGSLLTGAAGFLKGKAATTNFNEYGLLGQYCENVVKTRIVEDSNVISAGAVASSLDLGLYLCEKLIGKEKTEEIRIAMDYHPKEIQITNIAGDARSE